MSNTRPWVEKYRPKKLDDITDQKHAVDMLKRMVHTRNMPHCIFFGPPGSGKTSAALAMCTELFGAKNLRDRLLELNASDERGIDVIRNRIKSYARVASGDLDNAPEDATNDAISPLNWKIVMLDEADMLTTDAQSALRRIMEIYSKSTRFILICNWVNRIIDPIFSRCARCKFQPLGRSTMLKRLQIIVQSENVSINENGINSICKISAGDMRSAVTLLQTCASTGSNIDDNLIKRLAGIPNSEIGESFLTKCVAGSVEELTDQVENIVCDGWDHSSFLGNLVEIVLKKNLDSKCAAKIISQIAEKEALLKQGSGYFACLMAVALSIRKTLL